MSTFKKEKVVMLPTNQKTNGMICKDITGQDKIIAIKTKYLMEHEDYIGHHLYIVSDDEIKEGDWVYENNLNQETQIYQIYNRNNELGFFRFRNVWISLNRKQNSAKKIIATTDSSLWRPSHKYASDVILLPQPSQQFIEKYIEEYNKGNVITDVLIEYELISNEEYFGNTINPDDDVPYFDERLKINSKDNTITIKKVKDSYSREEVIEFGNKVKEYCKDGWKEETLHRVFFEWDKWIEENL